MTKATRILVVEDDPVIAMDVQAMLEDEGYEVVGPVGTLEEGMELAKTTGLDLGLLDMNLHDAMSYPIAQALVQRHIPVVFLSGAEGDDRPEDIKSVELIAKPVATGHLITAVKRLINPSSRALS